MICSNNRVSPIKSGEEEAKKMASKVQLKCYKCYLKRAPTLQGDNFLSRRLDEISHSLQALLLA